MKERAHQSPSQHSNIKKVRKITEHTLTLRRPTLPCLFSNLPLRTFRSILFKILECIVMTKILYLRDVKTTKFGKQLAYNII